MGLVQRVLDAEPVASLAAYTGAGGGKALEAAREAGAEALIATLEASGLRGRGGGGFPTGTKWRTVAGMGGADPATVVVNGAEGEPGTFKDRTILRRNPYKVIEGALVAAVAVGADRVVIGMKESAREEQRIVASAIQEVVSAGWCDGISLESVAGAERYLLGEETALLEAVNGRPPFPRIAPPYRRGADDAGPISTEAAGSEMSDAAGATGVAPTLVNNVETMANVPAIVIDGPGAFRSLGTDASPGTIVCTVTGRMERHGVGEFELGTPLGEVLETLGGRPLGRRIVAVLAGTANPILPGDALAAPLSWEGLADAGGGLGSAGFIVVDDEIDIVSVAHGVSRFLATESCGQCTPCKDDGLAISAVLDRLRSSAPASDDLEALPALVGRVPEGARCYLAQQHQDVVGSLLRSFPDAVAAHADGRASEADAYPIVPLLDIVDGQAVLDLDQLAVNPDWGTGDYSGASPAALIDVNVRH